MINITELGRSGLLTVIMMGFHGVKVINTDYNKDLIEIFKYR